MRESGKTAAEALRYVQTIPKSQGATMHGVRFEPRDVVRFGFIGVGVRGHGLLGEMLAVEGARVTAVCDTDPANLQRAKERVEKANQPTPAAESDWRKLCERSDIDVIYICSPWEFHTPQAVYAMQCGKHAAVECQPVRFDQRDSPHGRSEDRV